MTSKTLRNVQDLIDSRLIDQTIRKPLQELEQFYATAISPEMVNLIHDFEKNDPNPIGLQYIPHPDELKITPDEMHDPIGDEALSPIKGIVHRYEDRVLLKPLQICPVYCRFCFRREHVGPDHGLLNDRELIAALQWIEKHSKIREVILSGGDPFILSPRRMKLIIQEINNIPHVSTIRIHTRVPFSAPSLMNKIFIESLDTDKALWIVVHANHPAEFTPYAFKAIRSLLSRGIPLLSQSVLLKNVNDNINTLENLLRSFVEWRIKPYYLHQLDKAPGTNRFYVPINNGQELLRALRGRVTGIAWPTYVLDIPGGYGKVPLGPDYYDPEKPSSILDPKNHNHKI